MPDDFVGIELDKVKPPLPTSSPSQPVKEWTIDDIDLSHLPEEFQTRFRALFRKYNHIFAKHKWDSGCTDLLEIKLTVDQLPKPQK